MLSGPPVQFTAKLETMQTKRICPSHCREARQAASSCSLSVWCGVATGCHSFFAEVDAAQFQAQTEHANRL